MDGSARSFARLAFAHLRIRNYVSLSLRWTKLPQTRAVTMYVCECVNGEIIFGNRMYRIPEVSAFLGQVLQLVSCMSCIYDGPDV